PTTTIPTLPPVTDLKPDAARASVDSVYFSWTPVSAADASYCVNCSGKPGECNITASNYTCTGLSSGAEHSVSVIAQAPGHLDSPPSNATGKTLVAPVASVTVTGSNVNCLDVEWPASNTSYVTYQLTCGSNPPIDAGEQLKGRCCGLQSGENLTANVVVVLLSLALTTALPPEQWDR
uniref:Fibronectin type-III domain-containing protein n=1 Tax=Macrostomum lignano TaxID=282301 RepID=A0A1I8GX09_9PLAT